ncbi:mannose-1-phosphate guanylyltransferase/mannose-6-phosphate isomerase [Salmonella enterica]|nr:mannose-1-phosphate guanylyltransferase/mannose-6-phosphate isomerase [Salmonella enterica]
MIMRQTKLYPVVMAGGSGSRLWPLSRVLYPKQFLCLKGDLTMLQTTICRLNGVECESPVVICNEQHRFIVAEQLRQLNKLTENIILEPAGRNTAPAIALAALAATRQHTDCDPLMLVLAADHAIANEEAFRDAVRSAMPYADAGKLVTFGIVPDLPETGYGYIRRGDVVPGATDAVAFEVAQFVEKPGLETAQAYVASGDYYWNSGMFLFRAGRYLEELKKFRPDILAACEQAMRGVDPDLDFIRVDEEAFLACPEESIDYAVMERTADAVVMPMDAGVDVLDIGMSGTEEIYFATFHLGVDGGIEVTASHNPMDYNGMKLVREGARPISGDTGLRDVQRLAEAGNFPPVNEAARGSYRQISLRDAYIDHLLGYISVNNLTPLKLVVNSGNGAAGPVIDAIEARLKALGAPVEFIKIHNTPDGTFPNGIPNPLLPECRDDTRKAVIEHGADMGIAFDGDFDRCFLFDEKGQFIEGYYIVGLLAEAFLEKHPGAKIIHDPRLTWNTEAVVTAAGGTPVMSKTGHAFIKERMRTEDAIYGGEMSAHHYFRDFAYCDSGMIPWLLVAELVCLKGQSLGELVRDRMAAFPASGEINSRLAEPAAAIARVEAHFAEEAQAVDRTDGLSMSFPDWRFNLRSSNTEPVVRLNVESRGDIPLMEARTKEILQLLNS